MINFPRYMNALILTSVLLLACGCVQTKPDTFPITPQRHEVYTPICSIYEHSNGYIGKTVRVSAKYESDGGTYSYFEGDNSRKSCKGKNIIQSASTSLMKDKSVQHFFAAGVHGCEKRNMSLCVVSADVDFYAQVRKDNGSIYLWMTRVVSFKYQW